MYKFFKKCYEVWAEARMATIKSRMKQGYWY
jgi:hypothetical protein